jgi:hypothetical protein
MKESLRRLTGKETAGEELQSQKKRLGSLRDAEIERTGEMRALGESGIEDPGAYGRAIQKGEGALGSVIAADTEAAISRRQGASPLLGTLLRENQVYTKTRTKQGALGKAAPYVKMTGKIAGGIVGGIYGGAAGAKMGSEMGGKPGEAMGEADKSQGGASTSFSTPQQTASPADQQQQTPAGGGVGQQDVQQGGGPALNTKKPNTGGQSGLMGLTSMFGGGATGG